MKINFDPANTIAVVVGIERYKAGERWNLNGPAMDAVRFVDWLTARSVPSQNIHLFLSPIDANVSRVNSALSVINTAITARAQAAGAVPVHIVVENDATTVHLRKMLQEQLEAAAQSMKTLFVFWGGHGAMESDNERRLFCEDARSSDLQPVNLESLLMALRSKPRSKMRDQVIIVDACANYYEEMSYRQGQSQVMFSKGADETGGMDQIVLLAASSGQKAANDTVKWSGAFSDLLLQHLEATPTDSWPDFQDVAKYLENEFARPAANRAARQKPVALRWRNSAGDGGSVGTYPLSDDLQTTANAANVGVGQLRTLVGVALAARTWEPVATRNRLVDFLALSGPAIERNVDDVEHDMLRIFAVALASDDRADELRSAVEYLEPNAAARDALITNIDAVRIAIVLRAIIGNAMPDFKVLLRCYRASLPDIQLATDVRDLDEIIEQLNDVGLRNDTSLPPALEFVGRLADALDLETLEDWVTRRCSKDRRLSALAELRTEIASARTSAPQKAMLYVDASQASDVSESPTLRYWLYDGAGTMLTSQLVPVVQTGADSLEVARNKALATILQHVNDVLNARGTTYDFNIELFVNLDQVAWKFDEWRYEADDEDSASFGTTHPLVLRWIDRTHPMFAPNKLNAWNNAARNIRKSHEDGTTPPVRMIARAGSEPRGVEAELSQPDFKAVVALDFVPAFDNASDIERRLLKSALAGGAPYVFWWRNAVNAADNSAALHDALKAETQSGSSLDVFPERCLKLRLAAITDKNVLGTSLVVIWDDPARNPLKQLFSHPPQRAT